MHNVLTASRLAVNLAIQDLTKHQLNSSHGFEAMFKTEDNLNKVDSVLLNIATGHASAHHRTPTAPKPAPTFICVTAEVTSIAGLPGANPYKYCQSDKRIAAYARPSEYILLCEEFFKYRAAPEPGSQGCPSVANNEFLNTDLSQVAKYQSYAVIHELVGKHIYLQGLWSNN
ncbi:hypothetical protein MMC34_002023 [Xylographa carneopallida]|nr:hypothetical protein [Xylographa carneopallida]